MVEHRSEKPGVDSSILSLGIFHLYGSPSLSKEGLLILKAGSKASLNHCFGGEKRFILICRTKEVLCLK